ncbi:GNAT family N-acetyltransferase [Rhodococcus sp. NPDC058521]|uniref:GNAT family N-acetyltransferase n=1 Tax=Rhodococcus sp. NPDC058521 TaxID=3346536 RepID=UPI00366066F1
MGIRVRPADRSDVQELSRVLADAFEDDPALSWVLPDPKDRAKRLARMFSAVTRHHHLSQGGVEVATDETGVIGGATLWDPPGMWRQSTWSTLGMMPSIVWAFGGRTRFGGEFDRALDRAHPQEPHWYLSTIGTGSAARGGGYGTALMSSRLDRCDAEGSAAYLESSKAANIPYYERFGFAVTGEIPMPRGGPVLYAMWRHPR